MLTVIANKNIVWSVSDTFSLPITDVNGFSEGDTLIFQVATNTSAMPIINNSYSLVDGRFMIELSVSDRAKLPIGEYIYRIIVNSIDGSITTESSGEFKAVWGAE